MKIRTDFITNSSSSAFLIIGVEVNRKTINNIYEDDSKYDALIEKGLDVFGEECVIGKIIANLDLDDFDTTKMNFSEVQSSFETTRDLLAELGISKEIKLIASVFTT